MLALDDARWSELTHAYGSASDIPNLLRQLALSPQPRGPAAEPFFSLWSSLCHQGDVYGASYAAVPHIVQIGLSAGKLIDFSFFLLPASVEVARSHGRGPEVPRDVAAAYRAALGSLVECANRQGPMAWDRDMTIAVAAALAVAKGDPRLAEALMNLDADWIAKINNDDRD
jgi:hypothetical protein